MADVLAVRYHVVLAIGVLTVIPTISRAQTKCVSPIMSCGCTITAKGFYQIGANLLSTQGLTAKGGCIDISSSQVVLSAGIEGDGGYNITGPGGATPTGVGVHVLSTSSSDLLELLSDIEGWKVGVEIDGNSNIAQDFTAELNGTAGVELLRASNNVVTSFTANENQGLGVFISGGASNQVRGATLDENTVGLLVGCSSLGIVGRSCTPTSASNRIANLALSGNSYMGLIIDFGNTLNIVNNVASEDNQFFDLYDVNADCGSTLWFFNFFVNSNQSCIH